MIQDHDIELLHHALGISDSRYPKREPYRNHFVAGDGHGDMPGLERLEASGMMTRSKHPLAGGDWLFQATKAGRDLAITTRPRMSRAKQRYSRFLDLRDCIPDLTFHQFITDPDFSHEA